MATTDAGRLPPDHNHDHNDPVSPRHDAHDSSSMERAVHSMGSLNNALNPLNMRADPDAQATVTDFLDFTEYLPSDMARSLTLIGKLDQTYANASSEVHRLTTQWGKLPSIAPADRPDPVQLRANVSHNMHRAVSSRIYSHAEAVRMYENINRHFIRAKTILAKLETMSENFPSADELKSPVATAKSPQMAGSSKITLRLDSHKVRQPRVPRITVPGEVLAPYELNYEPYSSDDAISSEDDEEDEESLPTTRTTPALPTRIKVVKPAVPRPPKPGKIPKSRTSVPPPHVPGGVSSSMVLARLNPPPADAVIGSPDRPWGLLTLYELAVLRKRMKKNAAWVPSDTMVARELASLGRGLDSFKAAKQKAEEEGKPFEGKMPAPIVDPDTGEARMPLGALAYDPLASDEKNLSNRGMKLNEAKKLKRELAQRAAEEAEESARAMLSIAREWKAPQLIAPDQSANAPSKAKAPKKRKRDSVPEADTEKPDLAADSQAQRPQFKRTKTETPVPPPQHSTPGTSQETPVQPPQRMQAPAAVLHSTTPIPLPIHGQDQSITAKSGTSVASATNRDTDPSPVLSPKKSTTPILPPVRETRKSQAARAQEQQQQQKDAPVPLTIRPSSRAVSPAPLTPKPDPDAPVTAPTTATSVATTASTARRPSSRGKATSQEPQPSLAADRPRRASTARNTPAPERPEPAAATAVRPSSRRSKRPAPGVISRTISGGNSAVGKRKAAPKKKSTRAGGGVNKLLPLNKDKGGDAAAAAAGGGSGGGVVASAGAGGDLLEVEVDDEGNTIDPNEPRYCLCNRVSFGTMIQCDNVDNCKQEWFHLECVELTDIPARTTKWYCPDCRILLNIGEKGEVSARGVKA
ncbi:hypothetical protein B0T17DRAFT_590158 [Bombardia bombarda]|uniref:PHD-type domain-containing protein n=1 Tax=Bombardia bombarda TaxID=252184 RepID=A0AA40C9S8_9PEZI|nr:hypothetical protein B0T17DRAFT_590158 [Bombardia bombarda]